MDIIDPPAEFDRPDDGLRIHAFGPPRGYSSGEIGIARFLVDRQEPRFPSIHTYWRPTSEELEQLLAGGVVQFTMICQQPPPVSAAVYTPQAAAGDTEPFAGRCDACGHRWSEHGRSGCTADDEAAMAGCECVKRGAAA